jgi:outer membrane protein OmpA-like peptidoglycan-associated protein
MTAALRYLIAAALGAVALVVAGCPSAYQRTYDQKTQELEAAQRAEQQQQTALHAEAQKYAAVIYFAVGSATVDEDGQRQLRWFVQQMQRFPQATFNVQGFTDSTGSEANNQALADQRAANVAAYLNSQGIDMSRIVTTGFGAEYAAETNATAAGRRNNRRVEVTVR